MADVMTVRLPPSALRVLISVNPKAGCRSSANRVAQLTDALHQHSLLPETLEDLPAVEQRANELHARGELRALVGVGGDGTAAELVNRTRPGTPLTMLPAGNENLLARYLRLTESPLELADVIAAGNAVQLDAAAANGRVFLLMLGCGFDAEVVHRVDARRRGHISSLTYFQPILATLRTYQYPELLVNWDSGSGLGDAPAGQPRAARWLFVFNLPCYGGGFEIAPQADGRDGLLDVCAFARGSWLRAVQYAVAVRWGKHGASADFAAWRAARVRIQAAVPVRYQLDGDPGGLLPVDVEVLPRRLTLVVSASRAAELAEADRTHDL